MVHIGQVPVLADVVKNPTLRLQVLVDGQLDAPVRWVATSELDDPTRLPLDRRPLMPGPFSVDRLRKSYLQAHPRA